MPLGKHNVGAGLEPITYPCQCDVTLLELMCRHPSTELWCPCFMVFASRPKHCCIGWDFVQGDENASTRGRLGRVPAFTLFGRRIPSTVELATVDIVCADVMKLRPYQA